MIKYNLTNKNIKSGAEHIEMTSQSDVKNKIMHVKVQTQVKVGTIIGNDKSKQRKSQSTNTLQSGAILVCYIGLRRRVK